VFISSLLGTKAEEKPSANKKEQRANTVDIHSNSNELVTTPECISEASLGHPVTKYQEVVLLRTIVELALVNLAVGDKWQGGINSEKGSCFHLDKVMAPPAREGAAGSGLSKLMSPVQDLGRSLLGFLIGNPQPAECAPPPIPVRGSSLANSSRNNKRDSIISTTSITSPGRQRPPGHPAHPSVNSTPIVIRRTKADKGVNISRSLESQHSVHSPSSHNADSLGDNPENKPHRDRLSANMTPMCTPPVSTCVSPEPRPPSSRSRRKKHKKNAQDRKEPDTGNKRVSSAVQISQPQTEPTISDLVPEVQAQSEQPVSESSAQKVLKQKIDKKARRHSGVTGTHKCISTSLDKDRSSPISEVNDNGNVSEHVVVGEQFNLSQEAAGLEGLHKQTINDEAPVDKEACVGSEPIDKTQCSALSTEKVILRSNLEKHSNINHEAEDGTTGYFTARNSIVITEHNRDNVDQFFESESDVKEVERQLTASDEIHPVDRVTNAPGLGSLSSSKESEIKDSDIIQDKSNHLSVNNDDKLDADVKSLNSTHSAVANVVGNPDLKSGPVSTQDESFPASSQIPTFSATDHNETETHAGTRNTTNRVESDTTSVKTISSAGSLPPAPPPLPPDGFLTEGLKIPRTVAKAHQQQADVPKDTKTGTLKKNKQLSREEALLEQLSGLDDTFATFLKTQLSIKVNPRERDGVSDTTLFETNTIRRKKERRRRTESESSETARSGSGLDRPGSRLQTTSEHQIESGELGNSSADCKQDLVDEQIVDKDLDKPAELKPEVASPSVPLTETQLSAESGSQISPEIDTKITKSQFGNEISEKYTTLRNRAGSNASEGKVRRAAINVADPRKRTDSNASEVGRERPPSVVELNQSEFVMVEEPMSKTIAEEQLESMSYSKDSVIDNTYTTDNVDVTNNNVHNKVTSDSIETKVNITASQEISTKTNLLSKPDPRAPPSSHDVEGTGVHDMTVGSHRPSGDSISSAMGAVHSTEKEIARQNLSKSDSGYSGHISVDSVDETDHEDHVAKRPELTVDQALLRYNRIVGKPAAEQTAVVNRRTRVLSEGTEYSDEITDSELDGSDDDDTGVTRRARDTRSYNSRRSSTDSSEDGFNQNVRDLKQEVKDLEEKFRKAMVANASLDNEKCQLMFQVDLLKDQVEEGEEQAALVVKELRAKTHDYEILKRDHAESVRAVQLLQQALNEQQAMLQERGLVLLGEGDEGEGEQDCDEMEQEKRTRAIVSQDTANILAGLGSGPLDVRIKRLAGQRDDLQDTVRRLKLDLEEERSRSSLARGAASMDEIERETKKLLDDYKFKISKSDQEIATLGANVARLESQVIRYKTASETAELSEENLKVERRKMQRELRDAVTRNEELETQNKHLEKRLDKLKTAKSNLLKEL